MLRTLLPILLCVSTIAAQAETPVAAPAVTETEAEAWFYKAFYLDRGERRADEAAELYRKFLAAAPAHKFAGRAARDVVALLSRSGKLDEAKALREKYASLLASEPVAAPAAVKPADEAKPLDTKPADTKPAVDVGPAGESKPTGSDAPAGGVAAGEALSAEEKQRLEQRVGELKQRLAQLEQGGDQEQVSRLTRQIERLERQIREGRAAPAGREGRGPAGGERAPVNFAEMTDEEINNRVKRSEETRGPMLERLRENGMADRADEIEKRWAEMKKLLAEGKKADAQKIWDEVGQTRRRRGGDS